MVYSETDIRVVAFAGGFIQHEQRDVNEFIKSLEELKEAGENV